MAKASRPTSRGSYLPSGSNASSCRLMTAATSSGDDAALRLRRPLLIEDDAGTPVWNARVEAYGAAHVSISGFKMPGPAGFTRTKGVNDAPSMASM